MKEQIGRMQFVLITCLTVLMPIVADLHSNPISEEVPMSKIQSLLSKEIIGPHLAMKEVQKYLESRIPKLPRFRDTRTWTAYASRLRRSVLDRVVYRGEASRWRDAKLGVKWLETIDGPGYRIRKLRYEALPGLWIPALLYEPEKLSVKVPAILNVNGHDANGKAAPYKQIRCINLAKRGMLALNLEWLGMGQLHTDNFLHYRMNQLDLCGTSGLAPFYLNMKRGLDILLSLKNTDPSRVALTGLSGGGWQTIFLSSLDTRIKLSCPVAGYSGFLTRVYHLKDLGDSEQTPCDLATIADYDHLTAMVAPRVLLLTYNSKDDCCFESGYALPPLLEAAKPIYKLFNRSDALHSHVNDDPGTHNYERDNREAFYRVIGEHFYAGQEFNPAEIPSDQEVKTGEQLHVDVPKRNADFHTLASDLSKKLPRDGALPDTVRPARLWQRKRRAELRAIVRAKSYTVSASRKEKTEDKNLATSLWLLKISDAWTVPAVELEQKDSRDTVIVISDEGRRGATRDVNELVKGGNRVLAPDLLFFGESKIEEKDYLFGLMIATIGDRPLGIQASQLAAIARWAAERGKGGGTVKVRALGPRSSVIALVAAVLEPNVISDLEVQHAWGSLKEVIEENQSVDKMPEMFCFGLLEKFDVKQLVALIAPRHVAFVNPSVRVNKELSGLKKWYRILGCVFDPIM